MRTPDSEAYKHTYVSSCPHVEACTSVCYILVTSDVELLQLLHFQSQNSSIRRIQAKAVTCCHDLATTPSTALHVPCHKHTVESSTYLLPQLRCRGRVASLHLTKTSLESHLATYVLVCPHTGNIGLWGHYSREHLLASGVLKSHRRHTAAATPRTTTITMT